jgi:NTP pyrophosphatase (non-canonical NTP hydrolase)
MVVCDWCSGKEEGIYTICGECLGNERERNFKYGYDRGRELKQIPENDIYTRALGKWGINSQKMMLIEEIGELLTSLSHEMRGRVDKDKVRSEIVDVIIMLEQMKIYYGEIEIQEIKRYKLERLEKKLE